MPPTVTQSPHRETDMEDVTSEEGREQRADDLFLKRGLPEEVAPRGGEEEEVYGAEEGTNVGELDDGHDRSERQLRRWRRQSRPRCLQVVSLRRR